LRVPNKNGIIFSDLIGVLKGKKMRQACLLSTTILNPRKLPLCLSQRFGGIINLGSSSLFFLSTLFQIHSNSNLIPFQVYSKYIPIPFQYHSNFIPVPFRFQFNSIPIPIRPITSPLNLWQLVINSSSNF
jgi:hypothetical protein